ncbi:MAG: ABC-2 type transport system permease protein [Myxococcota bacterium]|jgi:ABC-2 type transport system permease protein
MRGKRSPLWVLTWARIIAFVREPAAVFWVFGFPVILAVALGVAFRDQPPEPVRAAGETSDPQASRVGSLLADVDHVAYEIIDAPELERRFSKGSVDIIVTLNSDDAVTYRIDPTRPEAVAARYIVDDAVQRGLGRQDSASIQVDTTVRRGQRYIDFLLPGLIGMNLMGSSIWGVGYNIVQERNRKLLRRFAVTPLRRSHFVLSFILSRAVFLGVELFALIGFGLLAFDVTVQGSMLDVVVIAMVGGLSFTGLGVLCGSRTENLEVAAGLMNFVMMPMWLLSGVFFSYERFPEAVQPLLQALPLTQLNDALRVVINDGASILSVLPELAGLVAWGVLPFLLAVRIFRWR